MVSVDQQQVMEESDSVSGGQMEARDPFIIALKRYRLKPMVSVLVLGDSNTGKTSLIQQYTGGDVSGETLETIGTNGYIKSVICSKYTVRYCFVDTSNGSEFLSAIAMYARFADAVVLLYDVTNRASFESITIWRERFLESCGVSREFEFPMVVLGNKADLESRVVTKEEGRAWARQNGELPFYEVSAKTGMHVKEAIESILVDASILDESEEQMNKLSNWFDIAFKKTEDVEDENPDLDQFQKVSAWFDQTFKKTTDEDGNEQPKKIATWFEQTFKRDNFANNEVMNNPEKRHAVTFWFEGTFRRMVDEGVISSDIASIGGQPKKRSFWAAFAAPKQEEAAVQEDVLPVRPRKWFGQAAQPGKIENNEEEDTEESKNAMGWFEQTFMKRKMADDEEPESDAGARISGWFEQAFSKGRDDVENLHTRASAWFENAFGKKNEEVNQENQDVRGEEEPLKHDDFAKLEKEASQAEMDPSMVEESAPQAAMTKVSSWFKNTFSKQEEPGNEAEPKKPFRFRFGKK